MFHVATTSKNLPAVYQPGLNGLFGNFIKGLVNAVLDIISSVPIVGGPIRNGLMNFMHNTFGTAIGEGTNGNMFFNPNGNFYQKASNSEPTLSDQAIIKPWTDTLLAPYLKTLAQQLANAYANPDFNYQLAQINDVMQKMCVIRAYFVSNETKGLSALGIEARQDLMDLLFTEIAKLVDDSISKYTFKIDKVTTTFVASSATAAQFEPLITNLSKGSFTCMKYVATNTVNTTTPTKTTTTLEIKEETPKTQMFSKKNITLGLLASAILYLAFKPNKKKSKE